MYFTQLCLICRPSDSSVSEAVFRIRIRSIRMFLGLPDPHPDPLFTSTEPGADPAPDPSLFSITVLSGLK
jgi:hypothetical protein